MDDADFQTYELSVHRKVDAEAAALFDSFIGVYGDPAQDWVVESQLDLREGGTWELAFKPPGTDGFREHRVITKLDRPRELAYTATIIGDALPYDTMVNVRFEPTDTGTRISLSQSGFPTTGTRDDFASAWPDVLALVTDRIK